MIIDLLDIRDIIFPFIYFEANGFKALITSHDRRKS